MDGKSTAAPMQNAETTEELIGVLTAISVVSKRMTKKLALLEQSAGKAGEANEAARSPMPAHAD